jgi:sortase A
MSRRKQTAFMWREKLVSLGFPVRKQKDGRGGDVRNFRLDALQQAGLAMMLLARGVVLTLMAFQTLSWAAENPWHQLAVPDQSDWSDKRIASYKKYGASGKPGAVLSIPVLSISAGVFSDTIPMALETGVIHVSNTSDPGEPGNVAIAGHRDSFFRRLEGVALGTRIELQTGHSNQIFEVSDVSIVDALDVSPLDQMDVDVLTLITCYPFYYQGFAPDRYIVRARRIDSVPSVKMDGSVN